MSEEKLDKILSKVDGMDNTLNKVVKVVEIEEGQKEFATKGDVEQAADTILTEVDHFAKLHETLDHELVSMRSKYERLEERLSLVEQKVGVNS